MSFKNLKVFWTAVATLVGTIIGAGILGIPYVVAKAGFWTGILSIVLLGFMVLWLYMYLGEIVLRTKGLHQLPGYAEKYLGSIGKKLMVFSMIFGNYGALIAYILGVGVAVSAIFGGSSLIYSLIFFAVMALILLVGLKAVGKSELLIFPLILGTIITILFISFGKINPVNFTQLDITKILIPYGVILFAFLGASAIPVLREQMINHEVRMKKAIFIGVMIPVMSYILFAIAVVGVTGISTTEVATIGLGPAIGTYMILIGNFLAIITMTTSFLALGLALKETYHYDYKIKKTLAWALTIFIPLIIALSGFTSFVKIIGLSGVIAGGLEGVLIVLMAMRAKKLGNRKPEFRVPINWMVATGLIAVFVFGAGYYLWSLI